MGMFSVFNVCISIHINDCLIELDCRFKYHGRPWPEIANNKDRGEVTAKSKVDFVIN